MGYTENYKRFYFRDIQAITFVATKRRLVLNWIFGVPTVILLVLLLASRPYSDSNLGEIIFYAFMGLVFGVPLLVNNLLGTSCACYLRTAVQMEKLSSVSRLPRARKVLNRIRPLIAAGQGQLAPEEIPARLHAAIASPESAAAAPPGPARSDANGPPVIT